MLKLDMDAWGLPGQRTIDCSLFYGKEKVEPSADHSKAKKGSPIVGKAEYSLPLSLRYEFITR